MTHTPGPWTVERLNAGHFQIRAKQGPLTVSPAIASGEPDARLIAAAPDMLAALQDALTVIELRWGKEGWNDPSSLIAQIRAAIAKAKGQP